MDTETVLSVLSQTWEISKEFPWALLPILAYVVNYFLIVVKKPLLRCGRGRFAKFISHHCPAIHERVWITPWCTDGRLHTVLCYYIREFLPSINYSKREFLQLTDGQIIALDWLETKESRNNPNKPTILILPGLNGDSQINYIKPWVIQAESMGYRSVVFNFRGKGGVKLCTPKVFSPTDYKDLQEVVIHIKKKLPNSPLLAIGTSLGAIILGQYVCHIGENSYLEAAVLVSSLFNLGDNVRQLESHPTNIFFSRYLAWELIKELKPYTSLYKDLQLDMEDVLKSQTIHEFDTKFIAPLYGFEDVDHFHQLASLNDKLKYCKTPLLAICAADDPFQSGKSLPTLTDIEGAPVAIVICGRGGHLGFQEGFNVLKPSWADRLFSQFCSAIFESKGWKNTMFHG